MVKGVHICTPHASVILHAIPVLPDRSGTFFHLIQPGWEVFLQKQIVSFFQAVILAEGMAEIRSSHKSGNQMSVFFVQMAKALGKEDVAAEYEELYHKIVKKFQETFFDAEGNMTAQTQTAHIVALYFQLTPEKYITKTVEGLKRLLDKENGHLVTGFVAPFFT